MCSFTAVTSTAATASTIYLLWVSSSSPLLPRRPQQVSSGPAVCTIATTTGTATATFTSNAAATSDAQATGAVIATVPAAAILTATGVATATSAAIVTATPYPILTVLMSSLSHRVHALGSTGWGCAYAIVLGDVSAVRNMSAKWR